MSVPRHVCHRCRTKWEVKRGGNTAECPKCGCTNVGPTDPASSHMGSIVAVLLVALGGAWYFDLLPGEAKEALEDARDAVESKVEDVRREVNSGDGDERPERGPAGKKKPRKKAPVTAGPKRTPEPSVTPSAPDKPGQPESAAPTLPLPRVVVSSKSGVLISSAYLVKGKVKNTGGAQATRVRVVVTFEGAGGALSEVEASCPSTLAAGKAARYEAAVTGDVAQSVESFSVKVAFE